ncbi:hypothetical protein [Fimbriimonas ginsengisoli]|uniref:Nucleotide-diphospho-sugar transferase domain-containing protein n=1 Tax=Fimbriimonas ginsengisoli Gsoil 348 TaxID=661478 RepID=A0A068NLM3_FIMGI|nr:hypothetical protein [Fimbriimonas ginsengisoli]AIE84317.1 hypothetical protein OP10G_0949 [Fimbriimonas ginsengisoli Gsoil 348]
MELSAEKKRIVYTLAVGKPKFAECALGLGRSLKLIGDSTRRVVITDQLDFPWEKSFDEVIAPEDPLNWIFFSKLTALERTDADQVLFIDSDSLVFRRLDPIFTYCQGRGLCVQGERITAGDWYGSVEEACRRHGVPNLPQFNGGMIYYERTPECQSFIETCREYGRRAKELGFQRDDPLIPDEPCIALAMAQTGQGHLIPDEMDFQNSAVGLIGPLRLDVETNTCEFTCRRYDVRFVRPYIFHASRYIYFVKYWRQLRRLAELEEYEATHGFGHMSSAHKFARSIQKRILKLRGRL